MYLSYIGQTKIKMKCLHLACAAVSRWCRYAQIDWQPRNDTIAKTFRKLVNIENPDKSFNIKLSCYYWKDVTRQKRSNFTC